jgi:glycerol-3-phosphate cytidylyltransferase
MKKYKLGITFGAFELLHYGHVNLIKQAKSQCEKLLVCVSDDEYIRRKKLHEPVVLFNLRIQMVSALRYVDGTFCQSLDFGKSDIVDLFQPDVIFVGNDWTPETFTGEGLGVPVVYLDRTKGVSSTQLRGKYYESSFRTTQ